MSKISAEVLEIGKCSKAASKIVANLDSELKNKILARVASLIRENTPSIIKANQIDLKKAEENNLGAAKIDRLKLDQERIEAMAKSIDDIVKLKDPTDQITYDVKRDNNLRIRRITTPIGILLAIYESRPNVTSDISALAIKSGNCAILKCGSDSIHSSKIIADIYRNTFRDFNLNPDGIILVKNTDRQIVTELLQMEDYIDVVIPRGGKSLIQSVSQNTKIPIFKHLDGNCHTYIHEKADIEKARKIVLNAKLRRTGICGATESLVIDQKIADEILPLLTDDLTNESCEIRGDDLAIKIDNRIKPATNQDFYQEYLDKIVSVKIVNGIDQAIKHIEEHSSSHTECIITQEELAAEQFFKQITSAIIMHNASTQFADGGEFGLGAEVGISTGKLHARGPVGLEQLVTYKYIVESNFAIRKN